MRSKEEALKQDERTISISIEKDEVGSKIKELEKYWSKELKIPVDQFSKPFFQKTKWKKEYENKDNYHGVLRIRVRRSIDLLRKIFGYIEGINLSIIKT